MASQNINKGDIFSNKNICCKRPGNGISPLKWDLVFEKKLENRLKKMSLFIFND